MTLSPFDRELGTAQGRIVPSRLPPAEGDYLFVLGSDAPGRVQTLKSGDKVKIAQTSSNPGVRFVRPRVRFRAASSVPDDCTWTFTLYLDGAAVFEALVDRDQELDDLALNVTPLDPAAFEVAFELRFDGTAGRFEAELPGVYVDALELVTSSARPVFANRYPEPGDVQVPVDTAITLDIMDLSANIVAANSQVWIDGVLAWDGTTVGVGFNGPRSGKTFRDSNKTLRLVIDPETPFTSLATVSVRARYAAADGAVLDQTYLFTIEDLTAPVLELAQARDRRTVRATFSEAVAPSAATQPGNWTITPVQGARLDWGDFRYGPGVTVSVESVEQITPRVFDVTTDVPMTMRATYALAVAGVEDTHGNTIAPNAVQQFLSVDDRVPERNLRLVDRVPRMNVREDATQDLRKLLWAWQESIEILLTSIDEWLEIIDPRTAPEEFLDAMLADLGNPFEFPLSVQEKRKLVGLLVPIYRAKGSAEGIVSTIRLFLGVEVTISYPGQGGLGLGAMMLGGPGDPGSFALGGDAWDQYAYQVNVAQLLTDDQRDKIRGIAEYMQAANEHLIGIAEPTPLPPSPDHLVLGFSQLGVNWILH